MTGVLDEAGVERLLETSIIARLGCHDGQRTYVVPVAYAYDRGACYGHTSEGLKLRMLRANPAVCLEVEQVRSLSIWDSVIAWGTFEELSGDVARDGAELFMRRIYSPVTGRAATESDIARLVALAVAHGVVYRIRLAEKTGRSERGRVAAGWLGPDAMPLSAFNVEGPSC